MNLYAIAGVLTAFPLFYFLSFDPNPRVRVYLEINPSAEPTMTFDKISTPFGWAGLAPLAWVAGMGILDGARGDLFVQRAKHLVSPDLGSRRFHRTDIEGRVRASIQHVQEPAVDAGMKMKRPWSYKVFDVATSIPSTS
ncbi:hypothetical protein ACTGJ9_011125 [Bradyrhizobium sp. RDM12]